MSNSSSWTVRILVLASCLLAISAPLHAVTPPAASARPDILVLIDPPARNVDDFTTVIAEAARYKLDALGLASQVVPATPAQAEEPLPQVREYGASAALVCRYQVQGSQMVFAVAWHDAQSDTAVVVETRGRVDLHLDDVILAALDDILGRVQERVSALSARRASAQTAIPAQPAGLILPPAAGTGPTGGSLPPAARPAHRLLLSGGFAPFVPTGAASYYFTFGYLPSLLVTYFLDTPVGPLGVGLYTGMDYFTATGTLDSAVSYLIPVGVDLRYELGTGSLRPFFHLVGGPAVLVMVTGSDGTLMDILPFLKSGIGLEIDFNPRLGIGVLADYDVYFEMPYLLTGFSPSVNVVFHP